MSYGIDDEDVIDDAACVRCGGVAQVGTALCADCEGELNDADTAEHEDDYDEELDRGPEPGE